MSNSSEIKEGAICPLPSLFDIGLYLFSFVGTIFFLMPWELNMAQGLFFVFGTFFLLGLSFFCKKEVEYSNKYLGIFILYAFLNVFIHSFSFSLGVEPFKSFINFCIMSEGFIYVLCGCLLFYLIVTYKKNFNIVYPILLINILNLFFVITQVMDMKLIWVKIPTICGLMGTTYQLKVFSALSIPILWSYRYRKNNVWIPLIIIPISIMLLSFKSELGYSFNGFFAIFLALTIYFYIFKQYERLVIWFLLWLIPVFIYKDILFEKVIFRFGLWTTALKEIIQHPFFGNGFVNSLTGNTVLHNGRYFLRQNDFLNITRDLGILFLVVLIIFLSKVLKKTKLDFLWIATVCLIISCFVQTSFYYSRIAIWGIILLALKERDKYGIDGRLPEMR